ncbi:hypothetical protein RUM43_011171 [Polyplax serrata]|uniref:Uncharacterized protein n=1 Tax=Polyplax serrata TaxID=468196 RepID=A0AAN8P4Q9_POLSC
MNQENGGLEIKESSDKPFITRVPPSCLRNGSNSNNSPVVKNTRVSFPDDERDLVTGYLEPANPWDVGPVSPEDLVSLYEESCEKHGTKPLEQVVNQLKVCYQASPDLDVSASLDLASLEALEAILRRVRFQNLRIKSLELNDDAAIALFDMLEYYESTNSLSISCDSGLGPRSWQACSRLIKKAHSLEELDVKGTPLNEDLMVVFCRALKVGSKLTSLQLGRCGINGRCLIVLTEALRCNTSLQALTLSDNDLNSNDASQLGALLRVNNTLRFLDISNNNIENTGCEHICKGLMEQKGIGLEALVLWNTNLTHESGTHLASLLTSSCPIETLNIGQNQIGTIGISAMKEALSKNTNLQQLGVQAAQINGEGITIIADALAENSALRRIDARSNQIGVNGLTALKNVLDSGASVQRIDLDDSQSEPNQSLIESIRELCRLNEARAIVKEELENSRSFSFSRKISLTCETLMRHKLVGPDGNFLSEPKRTGRLRSPEPSPIPSPASSPLPSPSRNRFRVSRVSESSSSSGSSISPSSPVSSRFRVTVVEPATVHTDNNPPQIGFEIPVSAVPVASTPPPKAATGDETDGKASEKLETAPVEMSEPPSIKVDEPAKEEEARKRKVSVFPTKPQTSLEKLLGIFQNPAGLFNSVSSDKPKCNAQSNEVKNYADNDKVNEKDENQFWD